MHSPRAGAAMAVACLLAGPTACTPPAEGFDRVVLIVVDTLRRDHLGAYGGVANTPAIDGLAARGTRLDTVRASFHQTTMSMAALFTGRIPALEFQPGGIAPVGFNRKTWCGLRRHAAPGDPCVPRSVPTLAEQMRAAGFETLGVASNPFLHRPAGYDRGFDRWVEVGALGEPGTPSDRRSSALARAAEHVLAGADEALATRRSDRFFLYLHVMEAHDWLVTGRPSYTAGVEASDEAVGSLLRRLETLGLRDGALVVLTADHGEMLPGDPVLFPQTGHDGNPSFEAVLDVPFIVSPAVALPSDALIRGDQIGPLLLSLSGARPSPAWRPDDVLAPDETFTSELSWRTYRRGRWKSAWRRGTDEVRLFDLTHGEATDVAAHHPDIVDAHRARIDEIRRRLGGDHPADPGELRAEDRALLRSLGYAD